MNAVRVIGVGTPYGDDRAGLEIAARLRDAPPNGCDIVSTERPGVELIELLSGADAVIILDAVRSGAAPGTVHDLALERLPNGERACSSHGIGVAEALALAAALGHRPRGRFLGIEAGPARPALSATLHRRVAAAIEPVLSRAQFWVDYFRHVTRGPHSES